MIDGQIHNILSVASVISEIKEILEEKHGPLKRVSVAAAGRALKTSEGSMAIDISERSLISDRRRQSFRTCSSPTSPAKTAVIRYSYKRRLLLLCRLFRSLLQT